MEILPQREIYSHKNLTKVLSALDRAFVKNEKNQYQKTNKNFNLAYPEFASS